MKTYIVCQIFVTDENAEMKDGAIQTFINVDTVIRNVKAASEAEAIGKFVLGMADKKFKKKIDPILCYELESLIVIE